MFILVVDDDPSIRLLISANFRQRGHRIVEAKDGLEAVRLMEKEMPDLILLDLMMPEMDGLEVCRWVRERSETPIIVLSAHNDEAGMVQALDLGADDYVIKPFRAEELLARVRAVMRRAGSTIIDKDKVQSGEVAINLKEKRVMVNGRDVRLTRTEFALLAELAKNPNSVLSHDELLARVWGEEYRGSSHYLYVYFNRIRKKIGDESNRILEALPGFGYMLHTPPLDEGANQNDGGR